MNPLLSDLTAECTPKCRSHIHALQLVGATLRGSFPEIRAFAKWLCCNFSCVTDAYGRNLLHIAASCGKPEVLKWLLEQCHVDVDIKDHESGWTALHRSLFYGNLSSAKVLTDHNASYQVTDHEGLTPLEIVAKDIPSYICYSPSDPSEVYVWGSNSNFNLGLGNEQARTTPELVETFRRDNVSVSKVIMCKFHTVFMSNDGRVFSCGLGHGGRLGIGKGETLLLPKNISNIDSRCIAVAAAEDHMIVLTDKGRVWTCGQNSYHQLGHMPPPEELVTPRPISNKFLNNSEAVGVCAARYHSVIYTKNSIYTFGLNAGQLGHLRGERFQSTPREVSTLNLKGCQLSHVEVSDRATICATTKGEIYALHQYQCRKVASRQLEIKKLCVVGGQLDSRWCAAGESDAVAKDLTILLLTKSGKVFIWQESKQFLQRCIFTHSHQLIVTDIHLNSASVGIVSMDGAAFFGYIVQGKVAKDVASSPTKSGQPLVPLLDKENCRPIRTKRVPFIHRGTSITSDVKGNNFAVIQSHPKTYLLELPMVSPTQISKEMKDFYKANDFKDGVCDTVIQTGNRKFPVHKYILASHSEFFHKKLSRHITKHQADQVILRVDSIQPDVFEQILEFLYTNNCPLIIHGWEFNLGPDESKESEPATTHSGKNKSTKQSKKPSHLEELFQRTVDASLKLGIPSLTDSLKSVRVVGKRIQKHYDFTPPRLSFFLTDHAEMHDLCLRSSDGVEFPCHKCILVARVDYFSNMLRTGWIESSTSKSVVLPFAAKVLAAVINFVYTDDATSLNESENAEFLCMVLVAADHMLITRLKEMCEVALVDMITLKNATELLELSHVYNAVQLKTTCTQFIHINLPALLEANSFVVLSDEVVDELSKSYRQSVPAMCRRHLTPYDCSPTDDELEWVTLNFPVAEDIEHYNPEGKVKSKRRFRTRKTSEEPEKKDTSSTTLNDDHHPPGFSDYSTKLSSANYPNDLLGQKITAKPPAKTQPMTKTFPFQGTWNVQKNDDEVPDLEAIMKREEMSSKADQKFPPPLQFHRSFLSQKQRKQLKLQATPDLVSNASTSPENPWKKMAVSEVHANPVMSDIIKSEICEQEGLMRMQDKSLDLINLEEKAIQELLKHYNSDEIVDERITVTRVIPEKVATPTWIKH